MATAFYVFLHLGCLGAIVTGVTDRSIAIFSGAFLLRSIGVSVVYHRYFAHRAYRTSRPIQFLMGIYGGLTVMGGPLWWAQTHREHHRRADTPDDLHSPRFHGFVYSHCGWFLDHAHRNTDLSKIPDLARFPELVLLQKWDGILKLSYIGICYWWLGWIGVVWGFFLPTVIVLHMIHWIQSISHSVGGYRRYPIADNSRNHWLFGLISLGEGFHHNHHCFPSSARIGMRWWEFDLGYWILVLLAGMGIIYDLKGYRDSWPNLRVRAERHVGATRGELSNLAARIALAAIATSESITDSPKAKSALMSFQVSATMKVGMVSANVRELLLTGQVALQEELSALQLTLRETATRELIIMLGPTIHEALLARLDEAFADLPPGMRALYAA
jgi:stearoyl-CoA desaturase (delta-9 desaturase)